MNFAAPFIARPIATTLLTLGVALAGAVAFFLLPVSPLPQVDFPTIQVSASLPGANPETVATSVATPLERRLGAIADVTEMTSSSSVGRAQITLQFGLNRDIDGAARDVQAAINGARADLPANLRSNPTYKKVNPADAPVMVLTLTSATRSPGQIYDAAATVLQQKISQVKGVGLVSIGGSSLPAVRVELNPNALSKYGIGLEVVRAALASANANAPKGAIEQGELRYQLYTNDQARKADEYRNLVIAYRAGAAVRLSDVAEVIDSVEDLRNRGLANGVPAVVIQIQRQPAANIIETVDRVKELLPQLQASIPADVDLAVAVDRTTTIRGSLHEVERTLLLSIVLVIGVVFVFLRDARATLIPAVAVPVSLVATFGVMYLLGYSLNNLSLMALTVATGFVVDDAIVVLENSMRHVEAGMSRRQAALQGAKEVGFTVLSMSLSLVAVFVPLLLMGGIVGRLFREFSMVLAISIMVSLLVSLTTTPMMCARLIGRPSKARRSRILDAIEHGFDRLLAGYDRSLAWAVRNGGLMLLILGVTVCLNVYLYIVVPKGFFPQQDTGGLQGGMRGDQSISFQAMRDKLDTYVKILRDDPNIDTVVGFTGGGQTNGGFMFMSLKPLSERKLSADQVINQLRPKLATVPGANMFLQATQDIRIGGRGGNAQYQYTLQGDDLEELRAWAPKMARELQTSVPEIADVNSDQEEKGLEMKLVIDRPTAARLGLTTSQIDNALYDAFGQRQVSTIFNTLNQYHVVMEVAPQYAQSPEALRDLYVSTSGGIAKGSQATNSIVSSGASTAAGDAVRNLSQNRIGATAGAGASSGASVSTKIETMVPLSAVASWGPSTTPLSVNHQGPFVATTISFNLAAGVSLSDATDAISAAAARIGMPGTIHGTFAGTAKAFQSSLKDQPILILAALAAVYIVLGMLYESYVHPLTVLSTLPSAGIGALLALMVCGQEFTIIALIGVILLIGIVKKNAIMMIDFALDAERNRGMTAEQAIREACHLRFRPIMMTTMAALLGALPLALGVGEGAEMRQPLGIAIVGGLIVSQLLTLYTTPVVYLALDRLRRDRRRPQPVAVTT